MDVYHIRTIRAASVHSNLRALARLPAQGGCGPAARRRPWPRIGAWRTDAVPTLLPLAARDAPAARLPFSFAADLTAPS